MAYDRTLVVLAAGVVVVALLVPVALPAAIADPGADGPMRPGDVAVSEMAVSAGEVTGETAELRLHTRLVHRGNPTPNVSVRYRAIDSESGLVVAEKRVAVGELTGRTGHPLNVSLRVPREGGYRLEATVFREELRIDRRTTEVRGVAALTPAYARTSVGFADDELVEPVSVAVADAGANRTTLSVTASLTNRGDDPSDELTVELTVRQVDSNLVADRASVGVADVRPGRTVDATAELTVPNDYNYFVDAVLKRDGVVVDATRTVVKLDPEKTVPENQTREDVELNVGDFEQSPTERPEAASPTPGGTATATPGFGVVVAVAAVALLAALLATGRWRP